MDKVNKTYLWIVNRNETMNLRERKSVRLLTNIDVCSLVRRIRSSEKEREADKERERENQNYEKFDQDEKDFLIWSARDRMSRVAAGGAPDISSSDWTGDTGPSLSLSFSFFWNFHGGMCHPVTEPTWGTRRPMGPSQAPPSIPPDLLLLLLLFEINVTVTQYERNPPRFTRVICFFFLLIQRFSTCTYTYIHTEWNYSNFLLFLISIRN